MAKDSGKWVGTALTAAGIIISLLQGVVSNKQQEKYIDERVTAALKDK